MTDEHSPTTCTYCYQLECSVKVESMSAATMARSTGSGRVNCRQAMVTLGRNSRRQILLDISSIKNNNSSKSLHVSYLLDDCRIHMKTMKLGKGAVEIPNMMTVISLSNCAPNKLNVFLRSLDAKLTLMNELKKNASMKMTTPAAGGAARRALLEGLPNIFEKLSPLSINEIKQIQRIRGIIGSVKGFRDTASTSKENQTPNRIKDTPNFKRKMPHDEHTPLAKKPSTVDDPSVIQLSAEQKSVVRAVLSGKNVFFTGSAGTGKSVVLKRIIGLLPAETTFVTAATGVAACQIGGVTLHSFAGIGNGTGSVEQCISMAQNRKITVQQWKRCSHLIIDEISMIDADYFDRLEAVARAIRGDNKTLFGGIQLIVTGDFLQLPPVGKRDADTKFCFMSKTWNRVITRTILLKEVRRQGDDAEFVEILQQLRFGRCSTESSAMLMATAENFLERDGVLPTRLCTHTIDAKSLNLDNLQKLPGDGRLFNAKDTQFIDDAMLANVPRQLTLKIGSQVMLIKNLDLNRGLSNGSRGIVRSFSPGGFPVVDFIAGTKGMEIRESKFTIRIGPEAVAVRQQLPLKLAWAISIHKSQGLTLDCVEVSLAKVFADGQAYVALSRARSLKAIRVIAFDPSCVRATPQVVEFYRTIERRLVDEEENEKNAENSMDFIRRPKMRRFETIENRM